MELRHLRHFIAVAEERHFGRAAARLGIEQSPLSRSIRHLEDHLRCPLLYRSPQGSELTAMGVALLPEARAILAHAARLKTRVFDVEASSLRCLRLGVSDAVATPRLTQCLSVLRQRYPRLSLEIVALGAGSATAALEQGTIDLAVTVDPGAFSALSRVHCWTDRFVVAVAHQPPNPGKIRLPVSELLAAPEVLVTDAWAVAAERWLQLLAGPANGRIPQVRSVTSWLGLLATVAVGPGVALLPSGLEDAAGYLGVSTQVITGRHPRLPVSLVYRDGNQHPGIEALRAVISQRPWRCATTTSVAAPAETPDRSP
jgi:DNA-binding transcriptional LysR family regulator